MSIYKKAMALRNIIRRYRYMDCQTLHPESKKKAHYIKFFNMYFL